MFIRMQLISLQLYVYLNTTTAQTHLTFSRRPIPMDSMALTLRRDRGGLKDTQPDRKVETGSVQTTLSA